MKQTVFHHILCCCAALLCLAACHPESDWLPEGERSDCISLNLASSALPISRAGTEVASGAEVKLDHVDVLIFNDDADKTLRHHERIAIQADRTGKVTLSAKRSSFTQNTGYWVYIVANSSADVSVFQKQGYTLTDLQTLTQVDEQIHMTGQQVQGTVVPKTFLMDGIAYSENEEPLVKNAVVLYNGKKSDNTVLNVTLRRAAAKIIVEINKGEKVEFLSADEIVTEVPGTTESPLYYLRNLPHTTFTIAGKEPNTDWKLRTTTPNSSGNFNWTKEKITVTAYAYAHNWDNQSTLEKELRLIVNIPLKYTEGGTSTTHAASYYQIPVSTAQKLDRNTCYHVKLSINAPGGSSPSEPVELNDINYQVYEWDIEAINVGGETDRPKYLTLNRYNMEMRNIVEDSTTLEFASSSAVTVSIDSVYYINKFGQKQTLTKRGSSSANEWGENTGTNNRPNWKNNCTIKITPDENISGKIDVYGTVPQNNAVRYVVFTVTNTDGIKRQVKVAQYPLTYITNVEGYYSYRDDFIDQTKSSKGITNWEYLAGKKFGTDFDQTTKMEKIDRTCGCTWDDEYNEWSYGSSETGFFSSKVATEFSEETGLSKIYYSRWTRTNRSSGKYTYDRSFSTNDPDLNNHRMYHVFITATSNEYTLGQPRITTEGITDPGKDNAVLVSPSFMLASQLGAVMDLEYKDAVADHCKKYVEVARNGKIYDDWRLPTEAEIKIIYKYQEQSDVMDEVLGGDQYWSASGLVPKPNSGRTNKAIRCIRDAYDKK